MVTPRMNEPRYTDEELMTRFQAGDAGAFETLFERYKGPVFSFLVLQCGNRDLAADLRQDTFAKVIGKAQTFDHRSRFSTWIYAIARNAAIDASRRAKHRRHRSLEERHREDGPALGERLAGGNPGPDRSATAGRLREAIVEGIDLLPDDQREVFLLREYHGLTFEQIASVVDSKAGTVKSRMRYALASLRRSLEDYESYARTLP